MILCNKPLRIGKSINYNRFDKDTAINICNRILMLKKNPLLPRCCTNCYYHDGNCEFGREEGLCVYFKNDIIFTNIVHKAILNDYDWCIENLDQFCAVDLELFVAIYGKMTNNGWEIKKGNMYGN